MHTQVYNFFFFNIAEIIYVNSKLLKKFLMYENH